MNARIELYQRLQNFRVHFFRRLIGADIFAAELVAHTNDVTCEPLHAVSIGGDVGRLSYSDFRHLCLIDIDADAQNGVVTNGDDGIGHGGRVADAFSVTMVLAEDDSIDRRTNERLFLYRLGLRQLSSGQFKRRLRRCNIFFARLVVDESMMLFGLVVLCLGNIELTHITLFVFARDDALGK